MASRNDPSEESLASPDEPGGDENLPGEMLAEDLTDPGAYDVSSDEDEAEELEAEVGGSDDDAIVVDDTDQLAAAQTVADRARSSRPKRKSPSSGSHHHTHEGHPSSTPQRTTPARFVRQSADELKKVTWPTWPQVQQLFWAVLVLVLFVIAFVVSLDTLFGWVLLKLFG